MTEPIHRVLSGSLTPDQTLTYVHLPFDVPEGIDRIEVAYRYDAAIGSDPMLSGGNTVDIGIFDPRGVEFLNAGYRGWSGSARSEFTVGRDTATPGYMPGPMMSGTWHICLGAYKVAPNGCHYQVDIRLHPAEDQRAVDFPIRLRMDDTKAAPAHADGWYFGEVHCHTVNSDGDSTVAEIVGQAERLGLDFLAIMDHNNLTHQVDLARIETPLVLIPGYEVTTYYGHWNIWGDGAWVDFRVQSPADLERAIAYARDNGYLVSCNHPRPFGPDWAFPEVEGYACVEVWNGPWELLNTICLAFWEARLRRGERLTAVGGSDHHFSHRPHEAKLGHPTLAVYVPPGQQATARRLLEAMRAGHCFVTESPAGPRLTLRAGSALMGDEVTSDAAINPVLSGDSLPAPQNDQMVIDVGAGGAEGSLLQVIGEKGILTQFQIEQNDVQLSLSLTLGGSRYVRAQILDGVHGHVRALTNPLYLSR